MERNAQMESYNQGKSPDKQIDSKQINNSNLNAMPSQFQSNKIHYKDVLIVRYNPIDIDHQEKIQAIRKQKTTATATTPSQSTKNQSTKDDFSSLLNSHKVISGGVQIFNDNGLYTIKAKGQAFWQNVQCV